MALKTKTPPANYPLTLADAKAHLRLEPDQVDDNALVLSAIAAATAWVEQYTGRALITQTFQLGCNGFPIAFDLPRPPLISVDAITYTDTDGVDQTLAASEYQVDGLSEFGRVEPACDVTWPDTRDQLNSVVVEYQAGYGDSADAIPGDIVSALKLLVGQLYEHREQNVVGTTVAEIRFGVEALLAPYRIFHL